MTIYGPDISNYQSGLDLAQVAREKFDFIFCKVSEGSGYQDPTWPGFRDAARANNLLLAGYHYVRGDVGADAQAATFVGHLGDTSIPAMLDFEANSGGIGQFWAVLNAIQARGVHVALSYIPRWYWGQIGSPDLSGVPGLIQSSYVNGAGYASALYPGDASGNWAGFGGRIPDLLQFTNKATVAGRAVDCNAFRGTRDQLAALLGSTPPQEDDMPYTPQQLHDVVTWAVTDVLWRQDQPSRVPGSPVSNMSIGDAIMNADRTGYELWSVMVPALAASVAAQVQAAPGQDPVAYAAAVKAAVVAALDTITITPKAV